MLCRRFDRFLLVLALLLLSFVPAPGAVHAASTLVVNSLADPLVPVGSCPTTCTLRNALDAAQPGDTIRIDVTGTLNAVNTFVVTKGVTIRGPGTGSLNVDGQNLHRVFWVTPEAEATIANLTIQRGKITGDVGGGIINDGILTLENVAVRDSEAAGSSGGGMYSSNSLTLRESTIAGNRAGGGGGVAGYGILDVRGSTFSDNHGDIAGAILFFSGTASVTNSTLSSNTSQTVAEALWLGAVAATVTNSTLVGENHPERVGDTPTVFVTEGGSLKLKNSIAVNVGQGRTCQLGDGGAEIASLGNNLSNRSDCISGSVQGDTISAAAAQGLDPLTLNAPGTTMTHALRPGSPAIDGVIAEPTGCGGSGPDAISTDQRGVPRPQASVALRCDIGAYEFTVSVPTISAIGPQAIVEDGVAVQLDFTVGDAVVPPSDLQVSAASSNPAILPNDQLELSGSAELRTLLIHPPENANGTVSIVLTVSNGTRTASTTFTLTIEATNDPPTVSVPSGPIGTPEDTNLTFSPAVGRPISIADVDAGTQPLQVSVTATHGTVSLSGTTGLTVVGGANGSASVTVTGALTSINDALHGLRFAPTSNYAGTAAAIQIGVSDQGASGVGGARNASTTLPITVNAVNDPPVATNDSYTTGSPQTLTTAPAQGVLANDADVDAPAGSLTAHLVTGPSKGTLALSPDGGFTYTPSSTFAGTDRFTYRVSDGAATSSPATVTIAVTASTCAPRATVKVTTAVVNGKLRATVEALPLDGKTNNRLTELRFGAFKNGTVTVNGQPVASNTVYPVPGITNQVSFLVERTVHGQATTIPFEAVDACGAWPSFVGGGTGAGF